MLLLSIVVACDNKAESQDVTQWQMVEMPDISRQPITLSVASVINPRFNRLTDSQIEKILLRTQQLVKQHFDIAVQFSEVKTLDIKEVFERLDKQVIENRRDEIVDINKMDAATREKMQQSLLKTLADYTGNEQNVINFAQPYLLHPERDQKDFSGLSQALVDTLISRLIYWKNQSAFDGKPVLSTDGYHEWVWWDSLGYSDLSYDVMITNQLVASAENYAMDVHSSIRGGLTAGTTTYSRNTKTNSYVYIMVYPLINDTDMLSLLRDDESYTEQQIIDYSAALLTHELGHMLLHLGHPFGNKQCIMSPTMMLNYRYWYDNLDAEKCAIGSSSEMTPGAAKLEYNRDW